MCPLLIKMGQTDPSTLVGSKDPNRPSILSKIELLRVFFVNHFLTQDM